MSPGPSDTDYASASASASAIAARQAAAQTGPYRNGAAANFADFDQSYVPINPASDAQTGSSYTVRDGDSLQSIAASLWGDGSLWYLIADANGLTGTTALAGGMALAIPNKVTNLHNDSTTYRVYDPNKAVGDVQPDDPLEATPQPAPAPKKKHWYDVFVKIFDAIINIVVTLVTGSPALGNIAMQGFMILTGQQDKFNWKSLAMTVVTAGITRGLEQVNAFASLASNVPLQAAATAVTANALTQGIAVATGLQSKFDWTSVAVAGVGAYAQAGVSSWSGLPQRAGSQSQDAFLASRAGMTNTLVSGMAGAIASGAARTLINGSDFGDNILAALPDIVAATVGHAVANRFSHTDGGALAQDIAHGFAKLENGIAGAVSGGIAGIKGVVSGFATQATPTKLNFSLDDLSSLPSLKGNLLLGGSDRPAPGEYLNSGAEGRLLKIDNSYSPLEDIRDLARFSTALFRLANGVSGARSAGDVDENIVNPDFIHLDMRGNLESAISYNGKFTGHVGITETGWYRLDINRALAYNSEYAKNWNTVEAAVYQEYIEYSPRSSTGKLFMGAAQMFTGLLGGPGFKGALGAVVSGGAFVSKKSLQGPDIQHTAAEMAYEMRVMQLLKNAAAAKAAAASAPVSKRSNGGT